MFIMVVNKRIELDYNSFIYWIVILLIHYRHCKWVKLLFNKWMNYIHVQYFAKSSGFIKLKYYSRSFYEFIDHYFYFKGLFIVWLNSSLVWNDPKSFLKNLRVRLPVVKALLFIYPSALENFKEPSRLEQPFHHI